MTDEVEVEKLKIYLTPLQAQWCVRMFGFDPAETEGYVIVKAIPEE